MSSLPRRAITLAMVGDRRVDPGEGSLPADMLGVLRGEGVFETFLVADGAPSPFLERHAARLRRSAEILLLELGPRGLIEDFASFRRELPRQGRWRVRYTVLRDREDGTIRVWTAGPVEPPPEEIVLALSPIRRDPADPILPAKTISRAGYQLARRLAVRQGAWDALHATIHGDMAECTSANLFLWQAGRLCTPSTDRGILEGVTRGVILEACARARIPVEEGVIPFETLREADEVYVTSAILGLIPVSKIVGIRDAWPGCAGPLLARIRRAYHAEVARHAAIDARLRSTSDTQP